MTDIGAKLDELVQLSRQTQEQMAIERAREMERARGVKIIRLPLIEVTGANPLVITADQFAQGPDQGWVWSLKALTIEGMTRGGTPDAIQVLRQGRIIWELNGNQYNQTWGTGEEVMYPGELLGYQSVGTFASTAKIIIHGSAWQVPAEEIWKLL